MSEATSDPKAIFFAALDQPSAAERSRYLEAACGGDSHLRSRVEQLLAAHDQAGHFLGGTGATAATTDRTSETEALSLPESEMPLDFLLPSQQPGHLGRLGHYEVVEVVGRGGMGIVLRAFDEKLHRMVAIKVMAAQLATSSAARKRFIREARAAAAVSHDHIVTIHAVEEANGLPYIAMQFVAGMSLQERLDNSGPLELREIVRIGMQTAAGLAAAHAQGLIHRDIKPANILLENGVERVKITDFGLARAVADASMTQTGMVAGTPQYMSPEQARGETVDRRSDLFSLGSVLYAMCTGRPPFRGDSGIAVLKRVCDDTPRPIRETNPDIPEWLVAIVARLQSKDPAERYQTAAEVAELLNEHLAHLQHPSVVPLPSVEKPVRQAPVRRRLWATAAVVLLCVAAGLGLTEAAGVTKLAASVIRVLTPDGTLVVEVDDSNVNVTVEGDGGLVITGAGPQEVRLRPGSYRVRATKDGKSIREEELITITRGDKRVVKVSHEVASAPFNAQQAKVYQEACAQDLGVPVELTNSIGMKLRLVPPGRFLMGSPENEPDRRADEVQHEIKITKPFFLGTHLVTVGQFRSFVSETGYKSEAEKGDGALILLPRNVWRMDPKVNWQSPGFEQTDEHPATCLSWNDATAFCDWLSAKEGTRYTLSTEAQWEYACRAGSSSTFFFGDNDQELAEYAWFSSNSAEKTHAVGQKKPNAWGLYDMHGNVYQWTADWYAANYDNSNNRLEDPSGPIRGTKRVLRGGAWCTNEMRNRDAFRNGVYAPSSRATSFGLRVALVGDLKAAPPRGAAGSPSGASAAPPVAPTTAKPADQPFIVLSGKGIQAGKFDTLAEAVTDARDGDTIEIRGNGPFVTPALRVRDKALCLRAGEGLHPVIQLNEKGIKSGEPLIHVGGVFGSLILEGLEMHRVGSTIGDSESTRHILLHSDGGPLHVVNCRFLHRVDGQGRASRISLYTNGCPVLQVRNCQFVERVSSDVSSSAIKWQPQVGEKGIVKNCLFASAQVVELPYRYPSSGSLTLENNTLATDRNVRIMLYKSPPLGTPADNTKLFHLEARENILGGDIRLWENKDSLENHEPMSALQAEGFLQHLILWKEARNLYGIAPLKPFLTFTGPTGAYKKTTRPYSTLAEWQDFWGLEALDSLQGLPVFQGGDLLRRARQDPEKLVPEDFRLAPGSPGKGAGPGGKDLGADIDLVGPGAAYERWKKTPEYQQWLKDTGQSK